MTNCKFSHAFFTLVHIFLFFTSCNGQIKSELNKAPLATNESYKISKPKQLYKEAQINFGMQDRDGNLWFGSNGEGVFKYDGKVFTNYTMSDGLNSNTTYSIVEDREGAIWVGTNKGLNRFNDYSFENIPITFKHNFITPNYSIKSSPTENSIWSMMVDKNGEMWLGTDDGVYCYNENAFTQFLNKHNIINKDSLQLKGIFSILEKSDGSIWFTACQSEGISKFDGKNLTNVIPYKNARRTDKVIEDKNGNLWFACVFKGVGLYDGKTFTQNVFNEKPYNGPSNILEDDQGNIWFNCQNGLSYYDGKTVRLFTKVDGIPNEKLIPIFIDKSGQVWLSSKRMGLYKYKDGKFISFSE
jgi:ligand-binding sensor domain-containing protein